jgi:hypothetical protein
MNMKLNKQFNCKGMQKLTPQAGNSGVLKK